MKQTRQYENYDEYISFQSEKTLNPEKRKKWLGEEWDLKLEGFKKEFSKFGDYLHKEMSALCIGARTGQEVVALKEIGLDNVVGIDIVPHLPNVIKGDMHNLDFENDTFDFVYTNVIDHSIDPQKMINEMERVLKPGGIIFLQCQVGIDQDKYTEFTIDNPIYDILPMTNTTFCVICQPIERNFAGMNFEYVFQKSEELVSIYEKYGSYSEIEVPDDYEKLWSDINLQTQESKLDSAGIISNKMRKKILSNLKNRAFYLTRIADEFNCRKIAEVGTAEGWQYYTFCKYVEESGDKDGLVYTCDPRDVRNNEYSKIYETSDKFNYVNGTSAEMSQAMDKMNFFYIDGLHDKGTVIRDVLNLEKNQEENRKSVWVFDDFDERFGCFQDILTLCQASRFFKIYKIGKTASGKPSHQALIVGTFKGHSE